MIRVAVTTSADAAERTCAQILLAELEPVVLPCIEIRPGRESDLESLRVEASGADLLLLTSARTVPAVWPEGGMPPVQSVVVGASTARAVEEAGGTVETVGTAGGDELIDRIVGMVGGQKIVFPHSGSSPVHRIQRLRRAGAEVVAAIAYETVPIAPLQDPVVAALFASPSAVRGWTLSRSLGSLDRVAAIGPSTSEELVRRGRVPEVMPQRPSMSALITQLSLSLKRS